MFLKWISKSPSQRFSYKFFFLIKKAQTSFLISSAKYCPLNTELFNVLKSRFPSIWLGMILNISVSKVKFLILSSGSLDSSDDSSKNSSVNKLSYYQCSYSWFDRVNLLQSWQFYHYHWAWSLESSSSGVLIY